MKLPTQKATVHLLNNNYASFAKPEISTQPVVPTNETFIKKTVDYVKNKHFNFPLFSWMNSKEGITVSPMITKICFMKCNQTNSNIIDEKMATNDFSLSEEEMHLFGLNWGTGCRLDVLDSCKELFVYRENHSVESTKPEFASVPHETKMDFIKLKNGPLFFFENKEGKSGGHCEIIKVLNNSTITLIDNTIVKNPVVLFCEMAGELWLNENGKISKWNNLSGTFLPVVNVIPLLPHDICE